MGTRESEEEHGGLEATGGRVRGIDPRLRILHADMDAFFAAVEILDDPSLAGRPLIIGFPGRRGVVSTASYEARRFGVHSALPSVEAMRRCPGAVWRRPRGRRYAEVSSQVRRVFERFSPLVEPLSLDEAFLDVGGSLRLFGGAVAIARRLKAEVREATGGLTVSVGVAENKFLAKMASDLDKPDGLTVVPPGRAREFLAPLPVERLWGVGPRTAERLRALRLKTIGDVARVGAELLERRLGKAAGRHLWELSLGEDARPVETMHDPRSISTESTFAEDLRDAAEIEDFLFAAADSVAAALRRTGVLARTVQIKVRSGSFRTLTRARTLEAPTDLTEEIFHCARDLFRGRVDLRGEGVRLLGVSASGLVPADQAIQGLLFDDERERRRRTAELSDRIREEHGDGAIRRGRLLGRAGDPDAERHPGHDDPGRIRPRQ